MEAFLILAAVLIGLAAFDILAIEFGTDSRVGTLDDHARLLDRATLV